MMASSLSKASAPIAKKINQLQQLLLREKLDFEQVADSITDPALRCTILSVAQQNNQYAAELASYLLVTGNTGVGQTMQASAAAGTIKSGPLSGQNAALAFCSNNQRKIAAAYRKVMQEVSLYEGLQDIIGYQLIGIRAACLQLKLLISLTRSASVNTLQLTA